MKTVSLLSGFSLCFLLSVTDLGIIKVLGSGDQEKLKSCGLHKSCVPRYLCNENGTIIKDGRTVLNMRTGFYVPKNNHGCVWTDVCCADADKQSKGEEEEYKSAGCGYSHPEGLKIQLINAQTGDSQFGEFPWMVGVWQKDGESISIPQGGGALLAPNVVLTIAHRVYNISVENLMVRAGAWQFLSTTEPYHHQDQAVASKIIHPDFNKVTGFYDAAILILKTPFKLAPHIDTICLPRAFDDFNQRRCIVTGWGKKRMTDADYPKLLKKIDLPFVNMSMCERQLRATRLGHYFELHKSFVCAGGERDKDACFGDGGAPLACPMINDPNRYTLAGLVCWGLECGTEDVPGVYVDVQMLRPWIDEQMKEHLISASYYQQ